MRQSMNLSPSVPPSSWRRESSIKDARGAEAGGDEGEGGAHAEWRITSRRVRGEEEQEGGRR